MSSSVKRVVAMVAVGLALSVVAPSAQARPFAGGAVCNVALPTWPGAGSTTCDGSAAGVDLGRGIVCAPLCHFYARIDSYSEQCLTNEPPLVGTAVGELFVDYVSIGRFNWLRIGATALLVPPDTAGVAAFIPGRPIPTCSTPGYLEATVVGAGVSI